MLTTWAPCIIIQGAHVVRMNVVLSQILLYLVKFGEFVQKLLGDFGSVKSDYNWIVILFFVFVVFLVGFSLGRTRILLALVSIYAAAFIEPRFAYLGAVREFFKDAPESWLRVGVFFVIYVVFFAALNRSILKHRLSLKESAFLPVAGLSVLLDGLLLNVLISYFPTPGELGVSAAISRYFASKNAQFFWAIAPIAAVFFLKTGARKPPPAE